MPFPCQKPAFCSLTQILANMERPSVVVILTWWSSSSGIEAFKLMTSWLPSVLWCCRLSHLIYNSGPRHHRCPIMCWVGLLAPARTMRLVLVLFCLSTFGCQYQCNWLPETLLRVRIYAFLPRGDVWMILLANTVAVSALCFSILEQLC